MHTLRTWSRKKASEATSFPNVCSQWPKPARGDADDQALHRSAAHRGDRHVRARHANEVVARVLNRTEGKISGVAGFCKRFAHLDERKAALAVWCHHVESLFRPVLSNVVAPRSSGACGRLIQTRKRRRPVRKHNPLEMSLNGRDTSRRAPIITICGPALLSKPRCAPQVLRRRARWG